MIALIQLLTNVDHVIVLTRGGPSNATNLLLFYIFQSAHENFEVGKAAAATVISVAVLLAISLGSLGSWNAERAAMDRNSDRGPERNRPQVDP